MTDQPPEERTVAELVAALLHTINDLAEDDARHAAEFLAFSAVLLDALDVDERPAGVPMILLLCSGIAFARTREYAELQELNARFEQIVASLRDDGSAPDVGGS